MTDGGAGRDFSTGDMQAMKSVAGQRVQSLTTAQNSLDAGLVTGLSYDAQAVRYDKQQVEKRLGTAR